MRWKAAAATGMALVALAACGTDSQPPPVGAGSQPAAGVPGPGGAPGSPTKPPVAVNTAEALKVANAQFDLLKKQDWAGAWALWTRQAQKEVAKKEFVTANQTCPVSPGAGFELMQVNPISAELVELSWRREGTGEVGRGALVLSGGKWSFQPDGHTLSEYASGAAKAIANRRANGTCG